MAELQSRTWIYWRVAGTETESWSHVSYFSFCILGYFFFAQNNFFFIPRPFIFPLRLFIFHPRLFIFHPRPFIFHLWLQYSVFILDYSFFPTIHFSSQLFSPTIHFSSLIFFSDYSLFMYFSSQTFNCLTIRVPLSIKCCWDPLHCVPQLRRKTRLS